MTDNDLLDLWSPGGRPVLGKNKVLAFGRAVAARARVEALEEAAEECDALASVEGIAQRCAAAIRARATEG